MLLLSNREDINAGIPKLSSLARVFNKGSSVERVTKIGYFPNKHDLGCGLVNRCHVVSNKAKSLFHSRAKIRLSARIVKPVGIDPQLV